ncbi:MAG: CDP-diacylglycerol--serine O-phosphatidyltransferase [bacterium]
MRKVYLLPNLFTTAALFMGLLAILNIISGEYLDACWLILLAAVLDGFDGKIARLTHTESYFGVQYDSLSDLVAFGVAPSLLMFKRLQDANPRLAIAITVLFTICSALRLARFNVQASREEKKNFTGLPVPAAAGTVLAAFLLFQDTYNPFVQRGLPILMVLLSYLMVSKISYPSFKTLDLEKRKPFDYLVSLSIVLSFILVLSQFKEVLLLVGFLIYVAWGIIGEFRVRFLHAPVADQSAKPSPVDPRR